MLAIEVDGNSHNFEEVEQNDLVRQAKLESLGVTFVRFKDIEVKQSMNEVIRILQVKIEELKSSN